MPAPIKKWLELIPGYLQTLGQSNQGVPAQWHRLWERFSGHGVCVQQHPWDTDWDDVAETIFRCSRNGRREDKPEIMLVSYSWGVGYGAVKFLRALRHRGLSVKAAVFSDGVFHLGGTVAHRCGAAQVSAYLTRPWGRPVIGIPPNIAEAHWYVQARSNFDLYDRLTWLRGHELAWEANNTEFGWTAGELLPNRQEVSGTTHRWMDEHDDFQIKVIEVAEKLFAKGVAA